MNNKLARKKSIHLLVIACFGLASARLAAGPLPNNGYLNLDADEDGQQSSSPMTLVFADDFSTDPNTNGRWTIHRYANDLDNEAFWDATNQTWHLTGAHDYLGVAVFANYELTATDWRAEFRYRVTKDGGLTGGGDGFVFMFYKDKGAYGVPAFGAAMGFELADNGTFTPVAGYGLEFDYYFNEGCDPTHRKYFGLVEDSVCNSLTFRRDRRMRDTLWHTLQLKFTDGKVRLWGDGRTIWRYPLPTHNFGFSGVGFGAGTGWAYADFEIDDFQLWVR